jgi:hypothetical protein
MNDPARCDLDQLHAAEPRSSPLFPTGRSSFFSVGIGSDLAAPGKTLTDFKSLSLAGIYQPDGSPSSLGRSSPIA